MKIAFIIIALIIGLFSSAIPIPGADVWFSQFTAIMGIGFVLVAIYISTMSLSLAILFSYFVFSTIFIARIDLMSVMCLMQTGLCLLIATYISTIEKKNRDLILKVLIGLLFFQIGWGIIQAFNLDPIFKLTSNAKLSDTVGFNGSHNQYGLFLAALSPLVFGNVFLVTILFGAIVLSKTYTALIGMSVAYIFYNRKNKLICVIAIITTILFSFIFLHFVTKGLNGKLRERAGIWKLSIDQVEGQKAVMTIQKNVYKVIPCNKWFGYGFGKFFQISPYTQAQVILDNSRGDHRYEHAHNDYVELFFDCGRTGILLFLLVIFEMFWKFRKCLSEQKNLIGACLIAMAVCACSVYAVHTAYNGFLLCVFIGLLYSIFNEKQEVSYGT